VPHPKGATRTTQTNSFVDCLPVATSELGTLLVKWSNTSTTRRGLCFLYKGTKRKKNHSRKRILYSKHV